MSTTSYVYTCLWCSWTTLYISTLYMWGSSHYITMYVRRTSTDIVRHRTSVYFSPLVSIMSHILFSKHVIQNLSKFMTGVSYSHTVHAVNVFHGWSLAWREYTYITAQSRPVFWEEQCLNISQRFYSMFTFCLASIHLIYTEYLRLQFNYFIFKLQDNLQYVCLAQK